MKHIITGALFSSLILLNGNAMAAEFDDAVKEGYQLLSAKQYEKAAAAFRRGYALANGDAFKQAGALFAEGVALFRAEKTAPAEEVLQKSLTLRPDDPQTLYYLGYCRFKQNDLETALLLMKKSFERSKKSGDRFMAIKTICSFYAFYNRQSDAISELEAVDSDAFTAQERLDARVMQLDYLGLMKDIPHPDKNRIAERAVVLANEMKLAENDPQRKKISRYYDLIVTQNRTAVAATVPAATAPSTNDLPQPAAVRLPNLYGVYKPVPADMRRFTPVIDGNGELIVASAIVTQSPYNADNTGKKDASSAIQSAISTVAQYGGGVVYLPAGNYRIEKSIAVRTGVILCGEWKKPEIGKPITGTVLLAYANKGDENAPALLKGQNDANMYNLTIYYPEQDPRAPIAYPFSIDAQVTYIRNITLINSYQGIMVSDFSGSSVGNIYGTVLKTGVIIKGSVELATCFNIYFSSGYWAQYPSAAMSADAVRALKDLVKNNLTGMRIGKMDGLGFVNADLSEAKVPVLVQMTDDEAKVFLTARSEYGFGGSLHNVRGRRVEYELDGWYFGAHYADLDNYPELTNKGYDFIDLRKPASTNVYQAGDFGVTADGMRDESAQLQKALDHAGKRGGGTVLMPRGTIVIKNPITVPSGVELRGGRMGAIVRLRYNTSAILIDCDAGTKDPQSARAAIDLAGGGSIRGMAIFHARNFWEPDAEGGFTAVRYPYAVRGQGNGISVYDVTFPNAYNCIDLGQVRCDNAQVVNVWGTAFHNAVRAGAGSENVRLENINIDIGPHGFCWSFPPAVPDAKEKRALVQKYLKYNAVSFIFGDCAKLKTFYLSGYAPHRFMDFIDQGSGGCRDSEFWCSTFDVPQVETVRFRAGGNIAFYGFFATGGANGYSLWAEFDDTFKGKIDVFGLSQQPTYNNHAYSVGPKTLAIHLEHSLTTGRRVTATSAVDGWPAQNAVDGDPRTMWQTQEEKGPHILTVELEKPSIITRWRVHNAGSFLNRTLNTYEAELFGSSDGETYTRITNFTDNREYWVDAPIVHERPVRFVQLRIIKGRDPSSHWNRSHIAAFDVFGYPVEQ